MIAALKCFTETLNLTAFYGSCYYLVFKDRFSRPENGRKYVICTRGRDVNTRRAIFSRRNNRLSNSVLAHFNHSVTRSIELKINIRNQFAVDLYRILRD